MACSNLIRCIHKAPAFSVAFGRATTLVATQCHRQLVPQILTSPPVRLLLTQEYFKPLNEELKKKDPAEVIENLEPDMKKQLKIIQLEYQVLLQMGNLKMPEKMTDAIWLELLQFTTAHARKRYYRYLHKTELSRLVKEEKRQKRLQEKEVTSDTATTEVKNTMFLFVRKKTMNQFYYSRLINSMLYGQPIVFDMNFEDVMRAQDVMRLYEQFLMAYGSNKIHRDPFHFVLCNHDENSHFQKIFEKSSKDRDVEDYFFTITDKSYLDLYPHSKIVYLTPDAPRELTTFNHDAVYVLGGLVDKVNAKPLTLAKAKREQVKMAKLPLDRHLKWSTGNKSLTLNQMIDILLELKNSNDWQKALSHVPNRKITNHKRKVIRSYNYQD